MSWFTCVKLAAIAAVLAFAYRLGGNGPRAALAGFQASQAQATAKAVLAERASAAAELARVNGILKEYQDEKLNPIVPGIAVRLLERACPANRSLPEASANPGRARSAAKEPAGDGSVERATQAVFEACAQDAAQLSALQAAWPR